LIEVLNVMSGNRVIRDAVLTVDGVRKKIDESGKILDPGTEQAIKKCLQALVQAVLRS
jgi:hypothetical protein